MPAPATPNIVLIHCHDLGRSLGCYARAGISSPRLDALAAEGVIFRQAFCNSPLCSPSRGSLFTGRYPHATGLQGLVNRGWEMSDREIPLQKRLQTVGYSTHLFGVQHERKPGREVGYDTIFHPGKTPFGHTVAGAFGEFLCGRERQRPFFASVGFFDPHRLDRQRGYPADIYPPVMLESVAVPPYLPDNELTRRDLASFVTAVRDVDTAAGQVLDSLRRNGLEENTWVIFTTDHGIAFPGAKSTCYDPGIETALIMRWPQGFKGARAVDSLVSHVDLVPTILEALQLGRPPELQGQSYWAELAEKTCQPRTEIFAEKTYHEVYDPIRAIRTVRWKYIRNYENRPRLLLPGDIEPSLTRQGMGDAHLAPRDREELYDLETDPNERTNLAFRPETAEIQSRLSAALDQWMEETGDPLRKGPIDPPAGLSI